MATINMPTPDPAPRSQPAEPDIYDKILKGLQIAEGVFGVYGKIEDIRGRSQKIKQDQKIYEMKQLGYVTPEEKFEIFRKSDPVPEGAFSPTERDWQVLDPKTGKWSNTGAVTFKELNPKTGETTQFSRIPKPEFAFQMMRDMLEREKITLDYDIRRTAGDQKFDLERLQMQQKQKEIDTQIKKLEAETALAQARGQILNAKAVSDAESAARVKKLEAEADRASAQGRLADAQVLIRAAERSKTSSAINKKQPQGNPAERSIPDLGVAITKKDASDIKEAFVQKEIMDRKIDELIQLREENGTEFVDRVAVARGRQLSKDIILTYKNIAKLGVLSVSDEKILNAIIPSDPLGINVNVIGMDDPILSNLRKFRQDSNADFVTKLKTKMEVINPEVLEKMNKNFTGIGGKGISPNSAPAQRGKPVNITFPKTIKNKKTGEILRWNEEKGSYE